MSPRHRLRSLILLLPLGCSFDALGLGDGGLVASSDTGTSGTSTSGTATSGASGSSEAGGGSGTGGMASATSTGPGSSDESSTGAPEEPAPVCGDGVLDAGEACDNGAGNGPTRPCTPDCALNECGDGYPLTPGEVCDDGNTVDDDVCRNDCTLAKTCGNKKLDDGEQCDDGNAEDDDACIACKKAVCGDGFVQANVESCDSGSESATCNADCSLADCGDSKLNVSAGEVCDLGGKNGVYASGCGADCSTLGASCGDGAVDLPDEKCDPGAPLDFATCADDCQSMTCAADRGNCDDMFANGCEIDLKTDDDHCGKCDKDCGIFSCGDGSCGI